jgi:hypothetical protein
MSPTGDPAPALSGEAAAAFPAAVALFGEKTRRFAILALKAANPRRGMRDDLVPSGCLRAGRRECVIQGDSCLHQRFSVWIFRQAF